MYQNARDSSRTYTISPSHVSLMVTVALSVLSTYVKICLRVCCYTSSSWANQASWSSHFRCLLSFCNSSFVLTNPFFIYCYVFIVVAMIIALRLSLLYSLLFRSFVFRTHFTQLIKMCALFFEKWVIHQAQQL